MNANFDHRIAHSKKFHHSQMLKAQAQKNRELDSIEKKLSEQKNQKTELIKAHKVELRQTLKLLSNDYARKYEEVMVKMQTEHTHEMETL